MVSTLIKYSCLARLYFYRVGFKLLESLTVFSYSDYSLIHAKLPSPRLIQYYFCIQMSHQKYCIILVRTSFGKDINLFLSTFKLFSFFSFPMLLGRTWGIKKKQQNSLHKSYVLIYRKIITCTKGQVRKYQQVCSNRCLFISFYIR